jgi:hypothetical protein
VGQECFLLLRFFLVVFVFSVLYFLTDTLSGAGWKILGHKSLFSGNSALPFLYIPPDFFTETIPLCI